MLACKKLDEEATDTIMRHVLMILGKEQLTVGIRRDFNKMAKGLSCIDHKKLGDQTP
jgi:hypothetical protein